MTRVAVIDIGKTNAKLALVETNTMSEVAVITRPNIVLPGPPYPHFDVDGHWSFLLDGLARFHRDDAISAISVTTHGACAALLDERGGLAAPILDYEFTGPDVLTADYDAIRPDFAQTGSPRLPMGLNLGAQLHWMFARDPGLSDRVAQVLTYPQYWGFRLTGETVSDVSSLGCHTDLWLPHARAFSPLVDKLGLTSKMAPARHASDVLGSILPDVAARTGLPSGTPVYCGVHDSNASLLPHILGRKAPFTVVSTGTWVIAMSMGGDAKKLDPARDTLVNVSATGVPVPSARFMGGREFELLISAQHAEPTDAETSVILSENIMLMPAVVRESGPFPKRTAYWLGEEPRLGSGARTVAASFYLALMTATCLDLVGHRGAVIVEGPFARNIAYCQMLVAATGCPVTRTIGSTGTSHGAALLVDPDAGRNATQDETIISTAPSPFYDYATTWRRRAAASPK